MKRTIYLLLKIALVTLVVIQFIRPAKNEEGYKSIAFFEADTRPSSEVISILKTNCYDCHSNQTTYPWYAKISPINYWMNGHINEAKEHFNVSEWEHYSLKKKDHKIEELIEMVEEEEMPLNSYTWTHGKLSKEDRDKLLHWAFVVQMFYKKNLEVSFNEN